MPSCVYNICSNGTFLLSMTIQRYVYVFVLSGTIALYPHEQYPTYLTYLDSTSSKYVNPTSGKLQTNYVRYARKLCPVSVLLVGQFGWYGRSSGGGRRTPQTPGAFGSSSCHTRPPDVASYARFQRHFCRCLIYILKRKRWSRVDVSVCVGSPCSIFSYMSKGCAVSPRVGRTADAVSCAIGPVRFVQRRGGPSPINDGIHYGLYLL